VRDVGKRFGHGYFLSLAKSVSIGLIWPLIAGRLSLPIEAQAPARPLPRPKKADEENLDVQTDGIKR
jgi:hypothetical protein